MYVLQWNIFNGYNYDWAQDKNSQANFWKLFTDSYSHSQDFNKLREIVLWKTDLSRIIASTVTLQWLLQNQNTSKKDHWDTKSQCWSKCNLRKSPVISTIKNLKVKAVWNCTKWVIIKLVYWTWCRDYHQYHWSKRKHMFFKMKLPTIIIDIINVLNQHYSSIIIKADMCSR